MKRTEVIQLFEYFLSRKPGRSGMRLRSEAELSRLLGENRQKIRRALDVLVEGGYLTRRHGSGTFIRKIFPAELAPPEELVRRYTKVIPEQLFSDEVEIRRLRPIRGQQQLRIGIAADPALQNRPNAIFTQAVHLRLEENGHKAVPFSQLSYDFSLFKTSEELAEELLRSNCDGFLIEAFRSEIFNSALTIAFGDKRPPVTYYWSGSIAVRHEPLVFLDTAGALERAITLLVETGYRRIVLLTMEQVAHAAEDEIRVYRRKLREHDLPDELIVTTENYNDDRLKSQLDDLWQHQHPDALYVADDHYLPPVAEWLAANRFIPGRDLGLITLSNRDCDLPEGYDWSRLEMDPARLGSLVVDNILGSILAPDEPPCSLAQLAAWKPGSTIRRQS